MGSVYKLWSTVDPENLYVGSTKKMLKYRLTKHRCSDRKSRVYRHLRQYEKATWAIELVEEYDGELRKREEYWRVQLGATLNSNRAFQTPEQRAAQTREKSRRWVARNREKHRENVRKSYAKHREKKLEYMREWRAKKKGDHLSIST